MTIFLIVCVLCGTQTTTLRKVDSCFLSNGTEYDCTDNFFLIMNQKKLNLAYNQKEIVGSIIFLSTRVVLGELFFIITHREIFIEILLYQPEIRLCLPFSD